MRWLILLSLFIVNYGYSQNVTLSPSAEIHVVTCGPGQYELYSAFGHSAFRVVDPISGIDYIYDYGVFDFNQPNFYMNFARGFLYYRLARRDFAPFFNFYAYYNRYFNEQQLNLSMEQKQKLFDYLEWNNLPENRDYFYDYFYDNCATKIPNVVIAALGDEVIFHDDHIETGKTIRQLTDDYLGYQPWGDLGIDFCLGLPMDKVATPEMFWFLPDYVQKAFDNASIVENGVSRPMVKRTLNSYIPRPEEHPIPFFTPLKVGWMLFLLILLLTIYGWRKGRLFGLIDLVYFGILGLLGLFLFLLWVATDHNDAAYNFNLLWAMPFHLALIVLLIKKSQLVAHYFRWSTYWYLVVVALWFFLPQQMHPALFPLALAALLRSYYRWKLYRDARS